MSAVIVAACSQLGGHGRQHVSPPSLRILPRSLGWEAVTGSCGRRSAAGSFQAASWQCDRRVVRFALTRLAPSLTRGLTRAPEMQASTTREMHRRLSGFLLGLMLLAAVGGTAQPPEEAPPGKRVDIGGRTLHLVCVGSGQPTVVFEAGGGHSSDRWSAVQGPVSTRLAACSYDRAGLGWSDAAPAEPHTMERQVLDLHALLSAAKVPGPYILVGHSVGGLLVRLYSDRYPNDVVGVVMVDPTDESFRGYVKDSGPGRWVRIRDGLQLNELNPARAAFAREVQAMHELRAKSPSPLGTRPLVVLIGGRRRPSPIGATPDDMWAELQREDQKLKLALAGLSRHSKAVVDPVSGHDLHVDHPQLVVLAIGEVADAVQQGRKLGGHGPTNVLVETPRRLEEQP